MASYTIYEKPGLSAEDAIDSAIMVRDHYSMMAFFFPPVWMLVKRLWWVLAAYLILFAPLAALESILPIWSSMLMTLLISLWLALEAPHLIDWSLKRKGYVEVESLYAEDMDHCERLYATARRQMPRQVDASQPAASAPTKTQRRLSGNSEKNEPVIGLFPAPQSSQETK